MRAKTLQIRLSGLLILVYCRFEKVGEDEAGCPAVEYEGSLTNHSKTVNCVRFSPSGQHLATGGDGGEIHLWKPAPGHTNLDGTPAGWKTAGACRGHANDGDVNDLAWAADASALISAGVDNICIVWDVEAAKGRSRIEDHHHYVQGVAWDPACQYVVSQSSDRTCRVYGPKPPAIGKKGKASGPGNCLALAKDLVCQHILNKNALALTAVDGEKVKVQRHHLFQDESMESFFRRPSWSPEGSLLVLPAGQHKSSAASPQVNAAYVYARDNWNTPLAALPTFSPVMAVRFSPLLLELLPAQEGVEPLGNINLPYRMVFAVATRESVIVYDTQSSVPLAVIGALHYDAITDVAWAPDGRMLAVSSRDGYCSIVTFEEGELGTPVDPASLPPHIAACLASSCGTAAAAAATPRPFHAGPTPQPAATPGLALPRPSPVVMPPLSGSQPKRIVPVAVMPSGAASALPAAQSAPSAGSGSESEPTSSVEGSSAKGSTQSGSSAEPSEEHSAEEAEEPSPVSGKRKAGDNHEQAGGVCKRSKQCVEAEAPAEPAPVAEGGWSIAELAAAAGKAAAAQNQ
ncbi:hypothetical protein WJX72_003084 [[Myrmecia] bisecta]|uniref:CAF1B/HIR1 beta-propeller domain-containing protein n=1 Tax=[Myrmecia] bisecta TaxID=41462 RepID=A0AAW1R5P3_9CHLO